jgi:hypothetical protein
MVAIRLRSREVAPETGVYEIGDYFMVLPTIIS